MPARLSACLPALCCWLILTTLAHAQQGACPSVRLADTELNSTTGELQFSLLARDLDCSIIENLGNDDVQLIESIEFGDTSRLAITDMVYAPLYDTVNMKADTAQILFLLDRSERVSREATDLQLALISDFLNRYADELGPNTNVYTAAYGADPLPPRGGRIGAFLAAIQTVEQAPGEPDMYRALLTNLNLLQAKPGKKIVFVLSDGLHVSDPERYPADGPRLPPTLDDVLLTIDGMADRLYLFPITLEGATPEATDGLNALSEATSYLDDLPGHGYLPRELEWTIRNQSRLVRSHLAIGVSTTPVFKGELRQYCLFDGDRLRPNCAYFRAGTWSNPAGAVVEEGVIDYLGYSGVGLILVGGMLGLFALLFPKLRVWQFEREYVVPFQPEPNHTVFDPATREPIRAGELVVAVCRMPVPLQTWQECNGQCPHYPECTKNTLQCDGAGVGESQEFFQATGSNRPLNWIWFGALGGFVGWLIYAIVDLLFAGSTPSVASGLEQFAERYIGSVDSASMLSDSLIGACFGTGLVLLLSIMEERIQSRRFSYRRVLLRTLTGTVLSLITFGAGAWLQAADIIGLPLVAAAITWMVFGLGVGTVLSVNSSVPLRRGLIGGVLGGLAGFGVYWVVSGLSQDYLLAKVFSLTFAGGVLGGILDSVIHLAEDFYVEYVRPVEYGRHKVPLSKWLTGGWDIIIGTQPGSQIYVKWPDEAVEPEHAKLTLEGGKVYLIPFAETLINGNIVSGEKRTQLQDGDTIQLGRRSQTEMRFRMSQVPVE